MGECNTILSAYTLYVRDFYTALYQRIGFATELYGDMVFLGHHTTQIPHYEGYPDE